MSERFDVVVVGAGTAGLQAALQLARTGRTVAVLERRPEGASGPRWCNGVLGWQFARAGLEPAAPPEARPGTGVVHMVSPSGHHRFTIADAPIVEADVRALVARLRGAAADAGVALRWGVTEPELEVSWGRPTAIRARHGDATILIEADLFVDAAGRKGVLRSQLPELAAACPPCGPADLCSAQQLVLEVADPDGARRFLEAEGANAGDAITAVGMAGGYSTISISVERSLEEVSVLTGSIPATGAPTGPELLAGIRAAHPWMGRTIFGGGGLIPLRRTYERFTAPGVALVGDAACQVMAGHGSGIGFGLIAGKVLAEAVATSDDPGDPAALWRYQSAFLREHGAVLAGYDAVRRMSTRLGTDGVERMFAGGVFSEALVRPGLDQRLGLLDARQATDAARRLAGDPGVARVVVPALSAMTTARGLYRSYPETGPGRAFSAWSSAARRLLPRQDG